MNWDELPLGRSLRIKSLGFSDPFYRHRLLAMGLLPGTEFYIVRIAPLGDPIEIVVRGSHLCLRIQEAKTLEIEEVEVT